jgi:hypothetical protein
MAVRFAWGKFAAFKAKIPQAETCSTKTLKQAERVHVHQDGLLRNFFFLGES